MNYLPETLIGKTITAEALKDLPDYKITMLLNRLLDTLEQA